MTNKNRTKIIKNKYKRNKDLITTKVDKMYAQYPTDLNSYEVITSKKIMYTVPIDRPVRIYCDGVYDLFHYGHSRSLKQAKSLFPNVYLIVGVTSDKLTNEYKGITVYNQNERAECLTHCKYVDEVIEDCPWRITNEFLEEHKIDYIAHDETPYKHKDCDDIYKVYKDRGVFIPLMRSVGISTSKIISNIVKDYDKFAMRSLERGSTAKELNINFLQLNRLKLLKLINSKVKRQYNNFMKDVNTLKMEIKEVNRYCDIMLHRFVSCIRRERILQRIIEFIS